MVGVQEEIAPVSEGSGENGHLGQDVKQKIKKYTIDTTNICVPKLGNLPVGRLMLVTKKVDEFNFFG